MEFTKINKNTIEVIKEFPKPVSETRQYDKTFLEEQLIAIQNQQDRDNEAREKEKAEVKELLEMFK